MSKGRVSGQHQDMLLFIADMSMIEVRVNNMGGKNNVGSGNGRGGEVGGRISGKSRSRVSDRRKDLLLFIITDENKEDRGGGVRG